MRYRFNPASIHQSRPRLWAPSCIQRRAWWLESVEQQQQRVAKGRAWPLPKWLCASLSSFCLHKSATIHSFPHPNKCINKLPATVSGTGLDVWSFGRELHPPFCGRPRSSACRLCHIDESLRNRQSEWQHILGKMPKCRILAASTVQLVYREKWQIYRARTHILDFHIADITVLESLCEQSCFHMCERTA